MGPVGADKSANVDVTVRIEKAESGRFDEIVDSLKSHGLTDLQPHRRFMIVNGRVSAARMPELSDIAGVASVREDETYKAR